MKRLLLTIAITSIVCSPSFAAEPTTPEQHNQAQAVQASKNSADPALAANGPYDQNAICPTCGKKMSDCECPSNPTRVNPDFRLM